MANTFVDKEDRQTSEALASRRENPNPAPKRPIAFNHMYLSHINVTMPKDGEATARMFYTGQLGLRELPKPESQLAHNGLWFEAGGLTLHLSVEERRGDTDTLQHFGLGCGDVDGLKARLKAAGMEIDDGPPVPWKRFFIRDPFGNLIEIHAPGGLRV